MIRTHRLINQNAQLTCTVSVCKKIFQNYSEFFKHLKEHIKNDNVRIHCPYGNCNKAYDNVQSFTGHLSKYHRNQDLICQKVDRQFLIEENNINDECGNLSVEIDSLLTDESSAVFINNDENESTIFNVYRSVLLKA